MNADRIDAIAPTANDMANDTTNNATFFGVRVSVFSTGPRSEAVLL